MSENIKTAKELARMYMKQRIPCWVIGKPGEGKSDMWEQLAEEARVPLIDERVSQLDPVDLRGLPHVEHDTDLNTYFTKWSRPEFLPLEKRDGPRGIMLLDELGDANRAMQSACYQLILNHQVGPHKVSKDWYICAASNSREHKAAAQAISTALANRFAWIEIESDQPSWDEWANKTGLHEYVRAFLKSHPGKLHTMEGGDQRAFASPRSWEKAARIIDAPEELRFRLLRGLVGEGVAGEFEAWLRNIKLPTIDEILANPIKCPIPKDPSSKYALAAMLSRFATVKNFAALLQYCKRSEFGRDYEICAVMDAAKRDTGLTETRAFLDFADRNQDLTL